MTAAFSFDRPRYPLQEAFALLGFSPSNGFRKVRTGALQVVRDGGRSFISAEELSRYLRSCESGSQGQAGHP